MILGPPGHCPFHPGPSLPCLLGKNHYPPCLFNQWIPKPQLIHLYLDFWILTSCLWGHPFMTSTRILTPSQYPHQPNPLPLWTSPSRPKDPFSRKFSSAKISDDLFKSF